MSDLCAIIAGAGSFPLHVAQEAKRQGLKVVAIGIQGWVDSTLSRHVDVYEEVAMGQLGHLIARLKAHHAQRAVMAGKVTKEVLFDSRVRFDADALEAIGQIKEFSVNALLGAIAKRLSGEGIALLDSSTFLKRNLCPPGVLTRREPTGGEQEDIRVGTQAARQLALLDIGQTVAVKRRVIVAVEALEGTDATIKRAGQVAGADLVVVKMASPTQDMRFDLPILGPQTIAVAVASGVRCVAVEAHKTLLLEKDVLLAQADEANLSVIGVELPPTVTSGQ
jgi:DUF1009 family protein